MFENCLSRAKKTTLHCSSVLVPEKLTRRIAREVLRLASCEPCGLRGCVLYIHLELDKGCKRLERIIYDATVVPTFELTLVFKQDGTAWPSLRDFFFMGTCFAPTFRHVLKLSPGFRLVKKKLYSSSAGTVVEECWTLGGIRGILGFLWVNALLPKCKWHSSSVIFSTVFCTIWFVISVFGSQSIHLQFGI